MTGVSPSNVKILNVTSSSRRRLSFHSESTASAGISTLYVVSLASYYSLSDLQSQLESSTSSGFFNTQLTANAEKFGAAGFVNATSTGVIIITVAPTAAPSLPPSPSSSNNVNKLSGGAIAGITIMSVVVGMAILAAVYYYFYYDKAIMLPSSFRGSSLPKMPSMSLSGLWSRQGDFDPFNRNGERRSDRESTGEKVTFDNPISANRSFHRNQASEFVNPISAQRSDRGSQQSTQGDRERESVSGAESRSIWSIFPSSFSLRQSWSRPSNEERRSNYGNKDRPVAFDNPIAAQKRGTTVNPLRSPQSRETTEGEFLDREREREKDKVEFVNPSFVNHPRIKKPKKEDIDIFL